MIGFRSMVPTPNTRGSNVDVDPSDPSATADDHAGTMGVDPADGTTGIHCSAAGEGIIPGGTGVPVATYRNQWGWVG